ncbi:MAG TPA: sialidase family protein, partial [Methylobacter sp.]
MKSLTSILFLATLAVSGCANDATVKPEGDAKQEHAHHHSTDTKIACVDATNQCAETISAAFDGKGVLWITWSNNDHVYVQSSEDKGISFTSPVMVNSGAEKIEAKGEYRPKIKLDAKGNIYLTWTQKLEGKHSGHIRFSRSSDGGEHFSVPVTVNDNLDVISHRFDSMAIGKNGEIFIAWLDARDFEAAKKAG